MTRVSFRVQRGVPWFSSMSAASRAAIAVVDDLEAGEGEVVVDVLDVLAVGREQRGEAAGGGDGFQVWHLALDPREHAVDEAEVAAGKPRLHVGAGVGGDGARRLPD